VSLGDLFDDYPALLVPATAGCLTLLAFSIALIIAGNTAPTASELAGQRAVIQQNAEAWARDMDLRAIAMVCASPPAGHCDVTVRAREDSHVFLVSLRCDALACRIAP